MSFSFARNFNFQNLSSSLQGSFKEISKDVNNALKPLNENLQPFTQETIRLVQERFIPNEDISELPQEYLLLEKKCDTLRNVYRQILSVTQTYELEGYDYPPNLKESIVDFSKAFSEKVQGLAAATTTEEAERVLSKPAASQQYPNTLAHALSRACINSRNLLLKIDQDNGDDVNDNEGNALAKVLYLFGESQKEVGDKRLDQDKLIFEEFNQRIQDILNNSFKETIKDRKKVETSRLVFDQLRHEIKQLSIETTASSGSGSGKEGENAKSESPSAGPETTKDVKGGEVNVAGSASAGASISPPNTATTASSASGSDDGELNKLKKEKLIELNKKLETAEDGLVNNTTQAVNSMKKLIDPLESINLIKIFIKIQLNYHQFIVNKYNGLLTEIDKIPIDDDEDDEDDDDEEGETDSSDEE